jgi:hypothetical protein
LNARSSPGAAMAFEMLAIPQMVRRLVQSGPLLREAIENGSTSTLRSLLGPAWRGLIEQRGKQGEQTAMPLGFSAQFDWRYRREQPELQRLYEVAKTSQWNGTVDLDWSRDVDAENPERRLLPHEFLPVYELKSFRNASARAQARLVHSFAAWLLSQFLHGEQGALFAAAQVTEAVQFFDGKLYGSTQVMDEGRHVEVFHRYLDSKMNKLYQVNDNLFVIIDSLMTDGRWDMKFLGMQIMVEGLALGAFGTLYKLTKEPLLRQLLKMVIQDEARHVHYGVLALREHITKTLNQSERNEREDWAFEVALLMRNRFLAYEVYEEWFEGRISREHWRTLMIESLGMQEFRSTMFARLVPNLREIGLMTARIIPRYEEVGLMKYFGGAAADRLTGKAMIAELDHAA